MTDAPILVQLVAGPPSALSREALLEELAAGRIHALAAASADGGVTWGPAWSTAGLPHPPQVGALGADPGMRMLLPVGRSGWAIAAGYWGLLALILAGIWAMSAAFAETRGRDIGPIAILAGITFAIGGAPAVLFALLGRRAIRRDPSKHGMGRVVFAYVCVVLLVGAIVAGLVKNATL